MVSVIIPNYNHAKYLEERIESVLHQSYKDFEVIILDDCSSDNSREIIKSYAHHPKVSHIVLNSENSGSTFKQWYKGFELARGEYIWIAESDDVADITFLDKVIAAFNKFPTANLVFSSMIRINEKSQNQGIINLQTIGNNPINGDFFIEQNMLLGCHILNASSAVFRKSSLKLISKDFTNFIGSGDYLFWGEIASTGDVIKINEGLDYFRHHSNKVTPRSVATGTQFKEVRKIIDHFQEKGYVNKIMLIFIAGFWQRTIRKCKIFNSLAIKKESKKIWERDICNAYVAEGAYYIYGIYRYIKKRIFNGRKKK